MKVYPWIHIYNRPVASEWIPTNWIMFCGPISTIAQCAADVIQSKSIWLVPANTFKLIWSPLKIYTIDYRSIITVIGESIVQRIHAMNQLYRFCSLHNTVVYGFVMALLVGLITFCWLLSVLGQVQSYVWLIMAPLTIKIMWWKSPSG